MTPGQLRQKIVKRERLIKLVIVSLIILATAALLLFVRGMLVSFLLAFVITYLFKPLVNHLERIAFNRTLAVIIPFTISGALLYKVSNTYVPRLGQQIESLETELPKYVKAITTLIDKETKKLNKSLSFMPTMDLGEKVSTFIQEKGSGFLTDIPNLLLQSIITLILAPIFAFFMLRDGRDINHQLLSLVPNNFFEMAMNLLYQINQNLGAFIRARLLESVIVGAIVWAGLYFLSFPYAFLLAIFAGVTNLVPYFGPIIGAVPGLVVAFVNRDPDAGLSLVGLVGLVYLVAQILDMVFVVPLVIAKIVDLHPVTVIIVIIVGGQLMGVVGMIISVPVTSIIKLTYTEFYNHVVDFRR